MAVGHGVGVTTCSAGDSTWADRNEGMCGSRRMGAGSK